MAVEAGGRCEISDVKRDLGRMHQSLTDLVRRFTLDEICPHINDWDEAETFPRSLYKRAADLGLMGLGYPEHLGGTPASQALRNAFSITMARYSGSGGVMASLFSHNIGMPPVLRYGSEALQEMEDCGTGHHGTGRRVRRGQPALHGGARWGGLRHQWRESLHHVGDARRLDHLCRAHWGSG